MAIWIFGQLPSFYMILIFGTFDGIHIIAGLQSALQAII